MRSLFGKTVFKMQAHSYWDFNHWRSRQRNHCCLVSTYINSLRSRLKYSTSEKFQDEDNQSKLFITIGVPTSMTVHGTVRVVWIELGGGTVCLKRNFVNSSTRVVYEREKTLEFLEWENWKLVKFVLRAREIPKHDIIVQRYHTWYETETLTHGKYFGEIFVGKKIFRNYQSL